MNRAAERSNAIKINLADCGIDDDSSVQPDDESHLAPYMATLEDDFGLKDTIDDERRVRQAYVDGYDPYTFDQYTRREHNEVLNQLDPPLASAEQRTASDARWEEDDMAMWHQWDEVNHAWSDRRLRMHEG